MVVDLAALKHFMRKSAATGPDDDLLQRHLDSAKSVVAFRTGGVDPGAPMRVYARRGVLVLPAAGLQQVSELVDPRGTVVDLDRVDVDTAAGIITLRYPYTGPDGAWKVTATDPAGRAPLELAIMIIAEHLWNIRRGTGGDGARDRAQARRDDDAPAPIGFAVPNRAAELIAPYSLALGFA